MSQLRVVPRECALQAFFVVFSEDATMVTATHPELTPKQALSGMPLSNEEVVRNLTETADLLEAQGANSFRVQAYRKAADTLNALNGPVCEILDSGGTAALIRLPAIGRSIAAAIEQMCHTGRFALLQRLRGESAAERILTTVTGIGPGLAARIHDELGIESLADLEVAACDGSLQRVPGMGRKRVLGVRESLAGRFRRGSQRPDQFRQRADDHTVSVDDILSVDAEYRRLSREGRLPRIAPRRFNPERKAWLPILHTERHDRHFTALFSNTAHAHELGATNDWVVIYLDDDSGDGQWTVITSRMGALEGRRIVRGREQECRDYYARSMAVVQKEAES